MSSSGAGAVEVPAPVEELHEAHALFDQPPGQQAVVGEARLARLRAVGFERSACGLLGDVHHLRHASLHAEGQFVLGDARQRFRVAQARGLHLVQVAQRVERLAAQLAVHARRIGHIQHRIALASGTARPETPTAESRCPNEFLPPFGCTPLEISTTKPGRFSFSVPGRR